MSDLVTSKRGVASSIESSITVRARLEVISDIIVSDHEYSESLYEASPIENRLLSSGVMREASLIEIFVLVSSKLRDASGIVASESETSGASREASRIEMSLPIMLGCVASPMLRSTALATSEWAGKVLCALVEPDFVLQSQLCCKETKDSYRPCYQACFVACCCF